jgi:hypothetical protein
MDINNHFEGIVECCSFLKTCSLDERVSKQDVIDSMEMRMHILIKRAVSNATFPFMSMSGWQIITEVPESAAS